MGLSLPMFLPLRSFARQMACVLAILLLVVLAAPQKAQAAPSSVETYTNEAVPTSPSEVMPSGMEWGKPLKAGDMVLPRLKKPAVSQRPALSAPSLPVGDVPAPKIISTGKTPLTASKA
ncbi:MAG: hypothetical protein HGA90_06570, partial [Alphaproteobacteria bacterium]|nr:hypothetical protein [Alphaproteobacteria bacterium]